MRKRLAATLAFALLLGTGLPTGWRSVPMQGRLIWIDIPSGLLFLRNMGFERADLSIERVSGGRAMSIVVQPGMDPDSTDMSSATRYCINGIYGVTLLRHRIRRILLRLPPEGEQLQYYFEFREDEATAGAIMKTFRIPLLRRHCVSNYAGVPAGRGATFVRNAVERFGRTARYGYTFAR